MNDTTKFQDDKRLSGKKGTGTPVSIITSISTVSKYFFCSGTYRVGLKNAMHVSLKLVRFVDYWKKRLLRVSYGNVFQQVAVDVYGANV